MHSTASLMTPSVCLRLGAVDSSGANVQAHLAPSICGKMKCPNNTYGVTRLDKFDRIYALHALLSHARCPVAKAVIEQELECSHATVERIIKDMRLYLGAPIEYEREANGYFYNRQADHRYELPGLWFNASELYALLITYQLLSSVEPGLLDMHITPLRKKIEALLQVNPEQDDELARRLRIIKIASRRPSPRHFSQAATALLSRQQLHTAIQHPWRPAA